MTKKELKKLKRAQRGQALSVLWSFYEDQGNAEQASYQIACEVMNIDPSDGYSLMAEASEMEAPVK